MPNRERTPSSIFAVPKIRKEGTNQAESRESNVLPGESGAEEIFRAALAAAGDSADADKLVRALVRAKTAPRQRTATDVVAPYLETVTFPTEEIAACFYDALRIFWEAIDREAPRPTAETARERAEDQLEEALSERDASEDLKKVRRLLRQAVEADPSWWESHLELADLEFHGFGNEEQARIHYGRALEGSRSERPAAPDPEKDPSAWSWAHPAARPYLRCLEALGDYHIEKGEWDKAKRQLERLVRHDPSDPLKGMSRLGEARERTGEEAGAIEAYRSVVSASGASEPGALYALGRLEIKNGEETEGRRTLWRAGLALPWAAAALLEVPFEGELDPDEFPEIEWIEIGLEYSERCDDLWRSDSRSLGVLREIWGNPVFAAEKSRAIVLSAQLMGEGEEPGTESVSPAYVAAKKGIKELLDPKRIATVAG
jgi:tetratricopeptide (TPR) repeat protein